MGRYYRCSGYDVYYKVEESMNNDELRRLQHRNRAALFVAQLYDSENADKVSGYTSKELYELGEDDSEEYNTRMLQYLTGLPTEGPYLKTPIGLLLDIERCFLVTGGYDTQVEFRGYGLVEDNKDICTWLLIELNVNPISDVGKSLVEFMAESMLTHPHRYVYTEQSLASLSTLLEDYVEVVKMMNDYDMDVIKDALTTSDVVSEQTIGMMLLYGDHQSIGSMKFTIASLRVKVALLGGVQVARTSIDAKIDKALSTVTTSTPSQQEINYQYIKDLNLLKLQAKNCSGYGGLKEIEEQVDVVVGAYLKVNVMSVVDMMIAAEGPMS